MLYHFISCYLMLYQVISCYTYETGDRKPRFNGMYSWFMMAKLVNISPIIMVHDMQIPILFVGFWNQLKSGRPPIARSSKKKLDNSQWFKSSAAFAVSICNWLCGHHPDVLGNMIGKQYQRSVSNPPQPPPPAPAPPPNHTNISKRDMKNACTYCNMSICSNCADVPACNHQSAASCFLS